MNSRQAKTLAALFARPVPADLRWAEVESLLRALGAVVGQRAGSRVAVTLNGVVLHMHRPHHRPELKKAAVADVRDLLTRAGVAP